MLVSLDPRGAGKRNPAGVLKPRGQSRREKGQQKAGVSAREERTIGGRRPRRGEGDSLRRQRATPGGGGDEKGETCHRPLSKDLTL